MLNLSKNKRFRGLATVEAAIVLPLLLLITFGLLEYGWLFLKMHELTNAARHGARLAIRPTISQAEVDTAIATLLADHGLTKYNPVVTVTQGVNPGDPVTVRITVSSENIAIIKYAMLPLPAEIGATVTMAREGP